MYSQGEIEAAVEAGALAPEQAASFREFVASRNLTPTADEEYFRYMRGFNDVFVSYACIVALVALGMIGALVPIGGRSGGGFGPLPAMPLFAPLLVAVASWGLAEIFTLRRRTATPSYLLTFTFGFGVFLTLLMIVAPMMGSISGTAILAATAAAIAAAATWGFWLRFRAPIAPALAVGLAVLAIISLLGVMFAGNSSGPTTLSIISLLLGVGVFALAMRWDLRDRWRITEGSEVALWLHALAAMMLVFPLTSLLGLSQGIGSTGSAVVMILLFLLFALLALVVNRKAILLIALIPLIQAVNSLIRGGPSRSASSYDEYGSSYGSSANSYGGPGSEMFGGTVVTMVIISLIMLLLAIYWSPIRRSVLGILPAGLRHRLAPSETSPIDQARHFE
jgi:hypothetical protein